MAVLGGEGTVQEASDVTGLFVRVGESSRTARSLGTVLAEPPRRVEAVQVPLPSLRVPGVRLGCESTLPTACCRRGGQTYLDPVGCVSFANELVCLLLMRPDAVKLGLVKQTPWALYLADRI